MSVTNKALFVIERNLQRDLTLASIAADCATSRFHLAHAFGACLGISVMDYVRGRRLTRAAEALAGGATDILRLALDSGYGSHEAFSRAFKSRFGKTPEDVRAASTLEGITLVPPFDHLEASLMPLEEPQILSLGNLMFVGLIERVPYGEMRRVAGLWQRFMADYAAIEEKRPEPPTGLALRADEDGIDYACAAGVGAIGRVPKGCAGIRLAPATYAVFAHHGHVAQIAGTYAAIWNWFPHAGMTPAEAPSLERHAETFDPRTGEGGVTIWIPLAA